jgi:hypothetical protein
MTYDELKKMAKMGPGSRVMVMPAGGNTITMDLGSASQFKAGDTLTVSNSKGDLLCDVVAVEGNTVTVSPPEDEFRYEVRKATGGKT